MKQKRRGEARQLLERLLQEHPDSPFSVPARNYLARLTPETTPAVIRQSESEPSAPSRSN